MDVLTLLGQLLNSTLVFSTALIFTALGGIFSERSGVVNIGLEGLMIFGAFAAGVGTYYAQEAGMGAFSPWVGVIAAMVMGALGALIHAVATITFKADQTISGIVINFLAAGLTVYIVKLLFEGAAETPLVTVFHKVPIPVLRDIPIIGEGFFNSYPTTYLALILVVVIYFVLFKTPFGLRLRSVGEHPSAADTLGVNVTKMRYIGVLLSGILGGIGGATITLTTTSTFAHNTISGQGFIAIAAMIFGKWNPLGAFGAAMFFGFSQAIRNYVQLFEWSRSIPQEFIFMIPYVLTIIVLVGAVGRSSAPAALGTPYDPGKR
ncbi:ABC transporter permease [Paenibacillus sp. DXFW5]|jgi:general nucleoside transport system permease protein|uniref:ABC transporter permease n=1 Tax=Paenibacillus rhizolycopersici TaxID=2780073 RepID=A0ABS2HAQ4_9BACL|nr:MULTISPECIES: ABC transporter permease [Paenibacillus]MBM6998472.1 ABC transporter permease [Paenibacillus rhizolycopersici]MUG87838.1 ABC transporter permease [Paenibacillus timonensis]GIP47261.1 putative ABC transporter permease protein YufQ [Paenibacillus sp. J53TS2]